MPSYPGRKDKFHLFHFRFFTVIAILALAAIFIIVGSLPIKILGLTIFISVFIIPFARKIVDSKFVLPLFSVFFVFLIYTPLRIAFDNATTLDSGEYSVIARISKVSYVYGSKGEVDYYTLSDISVDGKNYEGSFRLKDDGFGLELGDYVQVRGFFSSEKITLDDAPSASYIKGERYSTVVYEINKSGENKITFSEKVREKASVLLEERLGYKVGGFCYSMLFGDVEKLSDEDTQAFRHSGTAHVFAVSGLHVGVLIGGLLFIMRKLQIKPIIKIIISAPILFFYAYLTGFSPSVLRASFMVLYGLSAEIGGNRLDFLTSISFSALAVLLINPLFAFSISFQLSYFAVLGIACIQPVLSRRLKRTGIPFSDSLALSCSTTLAITPLSVYYFSWFSLLSVFLNLIVIPVISCLYILVICELFIALVIPSVSIFSRAVYYIGGLVIDGICTVNTLPFIGLEMSFTPLAVITLFLVLLLTSEQCLIENRHKRFIGFWGVVSLALQLMLSALPKDLFQS